MAIRSLPPRPPPPPPPPPKKEVNPSNTGQKQAEGAKNPESTALADGIKTTVETATTATLPSQQTQLQKDLLKDTFSVEGTAKRGTVSLAATPNGTPEVVVIKSIIDLATDDQHQIGELKIDDEGFTPSQAPTPEQVAQQQAEQQQAEEEAWLNAFANTNN